MKTHFVVLVVGGGTQINQAFERREWHDLVVKKHGPMGRELDTFEQKQVARDILEENQAKLQDALAEKGLNVTVVIPVIEVGSVLCHMNGDEYIRAAYLGFDELCVITTPERRKNKAADFAHLSKVKVMSFK